MSNIPTYRSFTSLRERWHRAMRNLRSKRELAALPADDLRAIAHDVGMSELELRSLRCGHPGPSELMPERMRQLGVDPVYLANAHAATFRDMARVCANCGSWRQCARDLEKGDVQAGMNSYCANTPTLDALSVDSRVAAE